MNTFFLLHGKIREAEAPCSITLKLYVKISHIGGGLFTMLVLVAFIFVALAFYVFYKVKAFRTTKPVVKQWLSAKSSIALGLFVALYGLNQLFLYRSSLSLIIGIIFVLLGFSSSWAGLRAYKKYLPHVIKEGQK